MQLLKPELNSLIQKEALDLFYKNGYQATLMRDLAAAVGMSVGNTYRYYKSKHDLFTTLVQPVHEKLVELLEATHDNPEAHFNELCLTTIMTQFTAICSKYHKESVIFLEYYLAQEDDPVIQNFRGLIYRTVKAHLPQITMPMFDLLYHFIATGTVFVLRKSAPENIVSNLKLLYVFLFKDVKDRINAL